MSEVRRTWYKLEPYWKASGASKKWKLIIYDAIIRSKLLYGLETIHLTQAMSRKLDAFQMRGLRRILQRNSTFIDRRNTNKSLLEEASSIAYPSRCDRRKFIPFSEYHMNRRVKIAWTHIKKQRQRPYEANFFSTCFCAQSWIRNQASWKASSKLAASYQKVCLWKHIRALWLWWDSHERSKGVWSSRKQTVLAFSLLLRQRLAAQSSNSVDARYGCKKKHIKHINTYK